MFRLLQSKRSRRAVGLGLVAALAVAAVYRAELAAWIAGEPAAAPAGAARAVFYTCSMDPSIQADHPGSCPICGMALTPVSEEERSSGVVRISAAVRQQIALGVAPVEARALTARTLAAGAVASDGATVVARIYRGDAGDLSPGGPVVVAIPDLPLAEWSGVLEAALAGDEPGALRVRVDDPDRVLRPGLAAEVRIDRAIAPRLVVPAAAVLQVGAQRVVFVDLGDGRFAPRTPALGAQTDGFVEVLDGLAAGDHVVVHGAFLLAAESRIRSDSPLWSARAKPAATLRPAPARSAGR